MIQNFLHVIAIPLIILLAFFLIKSLISTRIQRKKIKEQEEECDKVKKELNKKAKMKTSLPKKYTYKIDGSRKAI